MRKFLPKAAQLAFTAYLVFTCSHFAAAASHCLQALSDAALNSSGDFGSLQTQTLQPRRGLPQEAMCGPACLVNALPVLRKQAGLENSFASEAEEVLFLAETFIPDHFAKYSTEYSQGLDSSTFLRLIESYLIHLGVKEEKIDLKRVLYRPSQIDRETAHDSQKRLSLRELRQALAAEEVLIVAFEGWPPEVPQGQRDYRNFELAHYTLLSGSYSDALGAFQVAESSVYGPRDRVLLTPTKEAEEQTYSLRFENIEDNRTYLVSEIIHIRIHP